VCVCVCSHTTQSTCLIGLSLYNFLAVPFMLISVTSEQLLIFRALPVTYGKQIQEFSETIFHMFSMALYGVDVLAASMSISFFFLSIIVITIIFITIFLIFFHLYIDGPRRHYF